MWCAYNAKGAAKIASISDQVSGKSLECGSKWDRGEQVHELRLLVTDIYKATVVATVRVQ